MGTERGRGQMPAVAKAEELQAYLVNHAFDVPAVSHLGQYVEEGMSDTCSSVSLID